MRAISRGLGHRPITPVFFWQFAVATREEPQRNIRSRAAAASYAHTTNVTVHSNGIFELPVLSWLRVFPANRHNSILGGADMPKTHVCATRVLEVIDNQEPNRIVNCCASLYLCPCLDLLDGLDRHRNEGHRA
jgi:hypothetical protein